MATVSLDYMLATAGKRYILANGYFIFLYSQGVVFNNCDLVNVSELPKTANIKELPKTANILELQTTAHIKELETTVNLKELPTTANITGCK